MVELIEPPPAGLQRYLPRHRYFLLDEGREETSETDNTFSDIIALETRPSPDALAAVVSRLTERLQAPENRELRRALTVWIHRVVLQRLVPGTAIPPVNELKEIESMLAERVGEWTQTWKEQGIEEGRKQGIKEGIKEGIEEGIKEGRRLGLEEGLEQGLKQGELIALERQLTRRFGPIPEAIQLRLRSASTEQLEYWLDQILEAASIEDVFGE